MVVPVVVTAIVLFPFLLYIIFAHERMIPIKITMHELPDEIKSRKPVNPNIPNARGNAELMEEDNTNDEQGKLLSLEEIMNPFLDKGGASFGAVVMAATLVTVLVLNAVSSASHERPVFWVTLPAAFIMFCWDVGFGWVHRHETREIARKGRAEVEAARAERLMRDQEVAAQADSVRKAIGPLSGETGPSPLLLRDDASRKDTGSRSGDSNIGDTKDVELAELRPTQMSLLTESTVPTVTKPDVPQVQEPQGNAAMLSDSDGKESDPPDQDLEPATQRKGHARTSTHAKEPQTLVSVTEDTYRWCQETFPTVAAVLAHLPFALVPFAFSMFVLVQALVTKGWVPVFAYGWDHWVDKTGTLGAIGGMAFLSVILSNVSRRPRSYEGAPIPRRPAIS